MQLTAKNICTKTLVYRTAQSFWSLLNNSSLCKLVICQAVINDVNYRTLYPNFASKCISVSNLFIWKLALNPIAIHCVRFSSLYQSAESAKVQSGALKSPEPVFRTMLPRSTINFHLFTRCRGRRKLFYMAAVWKHVFTWFKFVD